MKLLFYLPLAALLASCSGTFPASQMGAVKNMVPSGGWAASSMAQKGIDSQWIGRFRDSRLEALVEEGLSNNHDLKIAAERVMQARAMAKAAGANARPQAAASLGGKRQKQNFTNFPIEAIDVISNTSTNYQGGLNASWELDLWGRYRAERSASLANSQASQQDLRAARASLAAQIARIWFSLAEANEQIELAREAILLRQQAVDIIKGRFANSLEIEGGTGSQLRLAQSDEASARANLAQWQGQAAHAKRTLEVLVGRYPAGSVGAAIKLPRRPPPPPAGLPSGLLLRRPDILAAERRFAGATQGRKEAYLALFPTISLTGSLGRQSSSLGDLLDSSFGVWSLGAGIAHSILTGGQITAAYEVRKSTEREALANLQSTVLKAFGEVERALDAEQTLALQEAATLEAHKLAREASSSAESDFRDGSIDATTLLTMHSREVAAASQLATLRRLRLENRINLHLALGGDWKPHGK